MLAFRHAHGRYLHAAASVAICSRALLVPTIFVMLAALVFAATSAAQAQFLEAEPEIQFDIPVEPLASALDTYSAATGKDVFYDGAVGIGRRSAAVKGSFTPENALKALLQGTGFVVVPSGAGTYSLVHAPERAASETAAARIASDGRYSYYFAIIQANVRTALCRTRGTLPGSHQLLIKFQIAPNGAIRRLELTGSTGDLTRDAALIETLQTLAFDEPPPATMPQPITMVVFSNKVTAAQACSRTSTDHAAR